jgi:hypothetical protein
VPQPLYYVPRYRYEQKDPERSSARCNFVIERRAQCLLYAADHLKSPLLVEPPSKSVPLRSCHPSGPHETRLRILHVHIFLIRDALLVVALEGFRRCRFQIVVHFRCCQSVLSAT